MNLALHSSDASTVLSKKEAAKQLPILKTKTTYRQGNEPDEDSIDYKRAAQRETSPRNHHP